MTRTKTQAMVVLLALVALMGLPDQADAQVGNNLGLLNPNLAGEEELLALPHLTEALVEGIMEQRPFLGMLALNEFLSESLSAEELAELYATMFIPLNLNTASREEILLIPNAGPRMAREFDEYRPYAALAQFRREIGKYVDDEEVARLEQYIFIPINLNTASDEDILSIPGVGARMLREFKEYRPYQNIEQFRREMGKYVDEQEVARMERYVTL